MKHHLLSMVLAGMAAGCAGNAPNPPVGTTSTYVVPGPPSASCAIELAELEMSSKQFKVGYNMPRLLVGGSQPVQLKGPLDAAGRYATVSGAAGTGTCDLAPGGGLMLRCTEQLTGVVVDLAAVEALAMQMNPATAAEWVAVAKRFQGEPIGVLEVR